MAVGEGTPEKVYPVMTFDATADRGIGVTLSDAQIAHIEAVTVMRRELSQRRRELKFGRVSHEHKWAGVDGSAWSYAVLDDLYVRITGYEGAARYLEIPTEIAGKPVVSIAAGALSLNDRVQEIICPDAVVEIGNGAFRGDTALRRLVLPASAGEFDSSWIAQCTALEELVLPDTMETIGRGVFASDKLTRLVVGRSAQAVEPGAFQGSNLTEFIVDPDNPFLATDGDALYSKDGIALVALVRPVERLVVAPGCTTVARKCCHGFVGLTDVQLPDSVRELEPFAFSDTGIMRFDAPTSLQVIGEKAFMHCRALTEVRLNDGLEVIGDSAFEGSALAALAIPASIKRVGASMTRHTNVVHSGPGCTLTIDERCEEHFLDGEGGLYRREPDGAHLVQLVDADMESYDVLDGAVAIDPYAFAYHDSIAAVRVPNTVRSIGRSAFRVCKALRSVELADSVESIGDEAFYDTNIESFRVPAALHELGTRALVTYGAHHHDRYPSLAHLEVAPGNDTFYIACGMLCERTADGASVVVFSSSEPRVEFPDEITRVEEYAFGNARGIEYLALNAGLSSIGTKGLSTRCWIRHIHVELARPVEGRTVYDFFFPDTPGAVRGIALGFGASWVNVPGIVEQLDMCLANARDYNAPRKPGNISAYEQARLILDRLADPVMLAGGVRETMMRLLRNHIEDICVDVALHDDRTVFDELIERGYVNADNLDAIIERVTKLRDAASSAYLLEAKRERFGGPVHDYDL
ncbi:MAG: leucine-rich repeat protein [Eggerthellaceae bacterium]|nr:leucine-rich repeat protein [Eggerthellaceae bacterium]